MREILFRGKRVDNGEWVEGCYIKANHHWHEHGIHEDWIAVDTIQNGGWCNVRVKYAVFPETVGQYTGLRDCKRTEEYPEGQMIFEGDIVRHHNGDPDAAIEKGKVYWDIQSCSWRRTSNGAFHHGIIDTYKVTADCAYEVIGNIHDNPELLGGGEDA